MMATRSKKSENNKNAYTKDEKYAEEKIIVSPIGEYLKYSGVLFMESNA